MSQGSSLLLCPLLLLLMLPLEELLLDPLLFELILLLLVPLALMAVCSPKCMARCLARSLRVTLPFPPKVRTPSRALLLSLGVAPSRRDSACVIPGRISNMQQNSSTATRAAGGRHASEQLAGGARHAG